MGKIFSFNWEDKKKGKSPKIEKPIDEFEYMVYSPEQINRINKLLVKKELKKRKN